MTTVEKSLTKKFQHKHTKTHCSVTWSSSIFVDYSSKWKSKLKVNESLWGQMQLLFVWSTNVFASGRWKGKGKSPEILYLNILKVIRAPSEQMCKKHWLCANQGPDFLWLEKWNILNLSALIFCCWNSRQAEYKRIIASRFMKYVQLIKVMNWIEMHIFHWTPPAVITDSGQNFANVIQGDLNAIRLEPAHGHSCNSKWSAHKCVLHVQYVAHCRAANIKMMIMHVEENPSSPGWMDGMAVNVQSMVLLSTRLEKQDAKPSQRRRRIKNYWSHRDGGDWFFSGLMEVLSTLSSEAGNGTITVSFECRRDNPCVPCIRSTAQTIKSISFISQILCTITHNLFS